MIIQAVIGKDAQSAGFEPARAEPNGFLVHRLNHSATTATCKLRGCLTGCITITTHGSVMLVYFRCC